MNTPQPLSLEDSCLARLVIDLQHYKPELLALLPLILRYRLLANLPVLDLCQLERTSVAVGVDLESIWRLRCSSYRGNQRGGRKIHQSWPWDHIDPSSWSWREWYLHAVAETVLSNRPDYAHVIAGLRQASEYNTKYDEHREHIQYYNLAIDWLISLESYQFLNESGDRETSYNWKKLASPFVIHIFKRCHRLTPPRYAHYKSAIMRLSDEELLTLLVRSCHFKPKCLLALAYHPPEYVDMSCPRRPSELLLQSEACDTLKEFLSEVEVVQFYIHRDWPNVPAFLLQSIFLDVHPKLKTIQVVSEQCEPYTTLDIKSVSQILAAIIRHQNSLQTIGLYSKHFEPVLVSSEFLDSLPGFIARPQFHTLDMQNIHAPLQAIVNIFGAFLSSPCSHQQTLRLTCLTALPRQPHPVTPCLQPVPDTGLEYKDLCLHDSHYDDDNRDVILFHPPLAYSHTHRVDRDDESYRMYEAFFVFPKIRLRVFGVGYIPTRTQNCINTIHMAAHHPDLLVRSLYFYVRCPAIPNEEFVTLKEDMVALLQMPTLTKLTLPENRHNPCNFFLRNLAQALLRRRNLPALQELDLGWINLLELSTEEVEHLFRTIFSLPQLSQLTLKQASSSIMSFQHYKLIRRLWTECGSGERLKKLILSDTIYMSKEERTNEFSITVIRSLLDSMAQSVDVITSSIWDFNEVKTDLIRYHINIAAHTIASPVTCNMS